MELSSRILKFRFDSTIVYIFFVIEANFTEISSLIGQIFIFDVSRRIVDLKSIVFLFAEQNSSSYRKILCSTFFSWDQVDKIFR